MGFTEVLLGELAWGLREPIGVALAWLPGGKFVRRSRCLRGSGEGVDRGTLGEAKIPDLLPCFEKKFSKNLGQLFTTNIFKILKSYSSNSSCGNCGKLFKPPML